MNLLAALLHTRVPIAASVLSERVEGYSADPVAFHRQFSRDKEALREMGVPILVEAVPDSDPLVDGYRIDPEQYYLPDPGFTPDELAALRLATRLVRRQDGPDRSGLFKLGGVVDTATPTVPPSAPIPTDPALGVLFDAIRRKHRVGFDYRGQRRQVVPRGLSFQNGHWYVSGDDLDAAIDKIYRVNRIEGSVVDEGEAAEVAGKASDLGPVRPWRAGDEEAVTAKIRARASLVPTISAQLGRDRLVNVSDDGTGDFTVDVASRDGFRSWVIDLGPGVEILEPLQLREDLLTWLDRAVKGVR